MEVPASLRPCSGQAQIRVALEAVAPPRSGWMKRKVSALSACFFRSLDWTSVVLTTGKGKAGGVGSLKDGGFQKVKDFLEWKLKLALTILTDENTASDPQNDFDWKLWVKPKDNGVFFTDVRNKDLPRARPRADSTFGKESALKHQDRQPGVRREDGCRASHLFCPILCLTKQIHLQGPQFTPLQNGGDNLLKLSKSFRLNVSLTFNYRLNVRLSA